jgi:hypothetical protein
MKPIIAAALLLSVALWARDKKLPSGDASNELVDAAGTVLDEDQMQQTFGTDFGKIFTIVEMTLTPRGDKPLDVHLDDFLLRSDQTGEHSGPLAAAQIAGQGTLVVHQNGNQTGRTKGGWNMGGVMMGGGGMGSAEPPPESKTEIKNSDKRDPILDVLKRKILAEKSISAPVTGLLFFPLEKEKPKNLELIFTTPSGKLRMKFK